MLIYLKNALQSASIAARDHAGVVAEAMREGALLRLRPKAMTVAVILAGLLPILWTGGAGAEVMRRIAAPLVGGMLTRRFLFVVIPAAYLMIRRRGIERDALARPRPDRPRRGKLTMLKALIFRSHCSARRVRRPRRTAATDADMNMEAHGAEAGRAHHRHGHGDRGGRGGRHGLARS
jgi:hypothetical protein